MSFNTFGAALAACNDFVFSYEQISGVLEGFLTDQFVAALPTAQRQVPALGEVFSFN